ncbi:gamma-glutamyltransferase [Lutibaculum baratangense]|uniref:Glutathione hydrolase proenzyme n=1 Tax=Lutibaculum baratangense AMV1 TaxID=631454 RepID=V4RF93_9HYPH|nr:gamma-glutamyltransferase [Lutibaculum baratangense]ESR24811.1 Gamma-glutamyltranspeptidase [Lutibaculum baratangense AMV1]
MHHLSAREPDAPASRPIKALTLCLAWLCLALPQPVHAQASRAAPEPPTLQAAEPALAERHMVVAAHPLAARAGREMLRKGGSAVDAAIAAQMVLGLVEPQSSGLGGGAFLIHHDAENGELTAWDGRETAPAAATPERFLGADGSPARWPEMVPGGLSVGVPGMLAMVAAVHDRHGVLPWADLFEPAIRLAREGFGVSPRLAALLRDDDPEAFSPAARAYFYDADGEAWPLGHVLTNDAYADTLERIAAEGPSAFYDGEIAGDVAAAVREAWRNPGDLSAADMAAYEVVEREPVCAPYRGHEVCGMGPPSSGAHTVGMTLAMLERFDLGTEPTPRAMHLVAEAEKLAFADRDRYIADPDFVDVPDGLLDPRYLGERSGLIERYQSMGRAEAGTPPGSRRSPGTDGTKEAPSTSHISVVDADGNVVSMTTTIESGFGSRLMARGFLLNNELTDFSFAPDDEDGRPVANRVEAGKRPRSSMAPTIVLGPDGRPVFVMGSPGGSRIIPYVVKAVIALVDWGMDPQQAAALFNFGSRNGPFEIERMPGAERWRAQIEPFGHEVTLAEMTSGLHIIALRDGRLEGGADPRREGEAAGD